MDEARRLAKSEKEMIGTTKQGIGPTYASKMLRIGLRAGDLVDWATFEEKYNKFIDSFSHQFHISNFDRASELDEFKMLREKMMADNMIVDSLDYVHNTMKQGKRVIAEGANATMLDIDHGTYPFVTSSSTCVGGVCTGLGVPPSKI